MTPLQWLKAVYNLKSAIVSICEDNNNEKLTASYDPTNEIMKLSLDLSVDLSANEDDDCMFIKDNYWSATFTKDGINIYHETGEHVRYQDSMESSELNITHDGVQEGENSLLNRYISAIESKMPIEDIITRINYKRATTHAFFNEQTNVPEEVVNHVLNAYLL